MRGFWVLIGPDFSAPLTWAFRSRYNFGPVSFFFLNQFVQNVYEFKNEKLIALPSK